MICLIEFKQGLKQNWRRIFKLIWDDILKFLELIDDYFDTKNENPLLQ